MQDGPCALGLFQGPAEEARPPPACSERAHLASRPFCPRHGPGVGARQRTPTSSWAISASAVPSRRGSPGLGPLSYRAQSRGAAGWDGGQERSRDCSPGRGSGVRRKTFGGGGGRPAWKPHSGPPRTPTCPWKTPAIVSWSNWKPGSAGGQGKSRTGVRVGGPEAPGGLGVARPAREPQRAGRVQGCGELPAGLQQCGFNLIVPKYCYSTNHVPSTHLQLISSKATE